MKCQKISESKDHDSDKEKRTYDPIENAKIINVDEPQEDIIQVQEVKKNVPPLYESPLLADAIVNDLTSEVDDSYYSCSYHPVKA